MPCGRVGITVNAARAAAKLEAKRVYVLGQLV
jgi:hypothetical protein